MKELDYWEYILECQDLGINPLSEREFNELKREVT